MALTPDDTTNRTGPARRGWPYAVRHYLEMVLAMAVGMIVLIAVDGATSALWGASLSFAVEVDALLMAAAMIVPMATWMRYRRHGWAPVVEMSAAMVVPYVALFVPLWTATITPDELMLWGHVLMPVAMAAAMALRPHAYTCPHGHR